MEFTDMTDLFTKAKDYLNHFCLEITTRQVGSSGNQEATGYFARVVASFGFQTQRLIFDCIDWTQDGAGLTTAGESFRVFSSPYSLGCLVRAPLFVASTPQELEAINAPDFVLLMRGGLAKEQMAPKNFPFYNSEEQRAIIHRLETIKPKAIIAATSRNPELAGGVYPFPLFEDGDFDIPSVYMTEEEGDRLSHYAGAPVSLESRAHRIPSTGYNVTAWKGKTHPRLVFTAHIDSKIGTPGALDNASGVATLLLLAELLQDYQGSLGVELVAFNGEDYYASPGEIQYLSQNQGKFDKILLNVNLDGVGNRQGDTAYTFYQVPPDLEQAIRSTLACHPGIVEGSPWYQGDHMVFVQNQVPALAFTSGGIMNLLAEIAHTERDRPELVDFSKLTSLAIALDDLVRRLSHVYPA
jgi:aminopeptidase YwaD